MKEEEEEAVILNGMNDEDTNNNINSCSEFENNRIGEADGDGDDNCNLNRISQVWGTWEELVLTCAVQRHAFNDWDSVAKEVQLRKRTSFIASPVNCRLKYQDLKRRFEDSADGGGGKSEAAEKTVVDDEVGEIPWLEQLRSLHVAELRRELQRCEDSIQSLQLKVTKLEEEKDGNDGDKKPDLGNDENKPAKLNRETTESDRDNMSMNESNSTASVDKITDHERLNGEKLVHVNENSRNPDPDPVYKVAAPEEEEGTVSKRSEMSHSGGLDESGTSTCPGRKKGQKFRSGGDDGDIKSAGDKSQPLIDIIKLIRSHPRGSVFESRLRSQGTKDYKSLVRQHLDIKTIEKKINKGSYVSSSLSFYRDLKLLFTNAIVFFPSSSSESIAAHELRTLVSNEMKKRTGKSGYSVIQTEAQSAISRQKSSVLPLVVCKKKNSTSKKTSPSSSFKHKDEKKSQEVSEEKTVTTTNTSGRNSRRTSKEIAVVAKDTKTERAKNNNKKQTDTNTDSSNDDDDEKEETIKKEKKTVVAVASNKKKSVADFLKRIKKNSPEKGKETTTSKTQKKSDGNVKKENDQPKKSNGNVKKENDQPKKSNGNVKKENSKAKPRELRSNTSVKRKAEVETNNNNKSSLKRKQPKETEEATGKRSRESVKNNKQTKKRSRR